MRLGIGWVALLSLAATGCGAPPAAPVTVTPAPATVTATATVTASPSAVQPTVGRDEAHEIVVAPIVDDVEDLKGRLEKAGLVCSGWTPIATVGGTCDGGILLNAFPDGEPGREAHRGAVAFAFTAIITQDRSDVALLVGPNWFVRADTGGAYVLQELFGGAVIGLSGTR